MHIYLSSTWAVSLMFGCWRTYLQQGGGLFKEVVHMEYHEGGRGEYMHGDHLNFPWDFTVCCYRPVKIQLTKENY